MKEFAIQFKAKQYIAHKAGLSEGVLTMNQDDPGFIEYIFPVRLMKQVALTLTEATQPVWAHHWFEHTQHWIAYHYKIDAHRKIVVKHLFGGLRARIQLIDTKES